MSLLYFLDLVAISLQSLVRLANNKGGGGVTLMEKEFTHWLKTFKNFLTILLQTGLIRFSILINYVSPTVYVNHRRYITILKQIYQKPTNEFFARHLLATRRQQPGETLDEFLQVLKILSKDCNFTQVTTLQHKEEAIRDAFIGIQSNHYSATSS